MESMPAGNDHSVEMLKQMGHDVRNALTSIQLLAQIALRNKELETAVRTKDFIQKIDGQSVKLGNLVNDLLDISRIHSGRLEIKKQTTDLRPFLDDLVSKLTVHFPGLEVTRLEMEALQVSIDPLRLQQVFINYIAHAVRICPQTSEIKLSARNMDQLAVIILDFQPPFECDETAFLGMAPAEQLLPVPSDPGLYIAGEIIRLHEGRIRVERGEESGTIISIYLPI